MLLKNVKMVDARPSHMFNSILDLSPDLQAKAKKFFNAYEWALVWLADAGGNAERKERNAWESAKREVPVSEIEEEIFRNILKAESSSSGADKPVQLPPTSDPIPKPE